MDEESFRGDGMGWDGMEWDCFFVGWRKWWGVEIWGWVGGGKWGGGEG